eukprot:scaffold808_cov196-Alexandrium_tamarense.AAC.117
MMPCLIQPIPSCAIMGGGECAGVRSWWLFMGIDAIQGAPLSVRSWGFYAGGLYAYNIIQCPMETIHGRQSAMHNVAAGGILGYVGVSRGRLGVPFVSPYILYGMRYPGLVGAAVYGAIAGGMATLGGKPCDNSTKQPKPTEGKQLASTMPLPITDSFLLLKIEKDTQIKSNTC